VHKFVPDRQIAELVARGLREGRSLRAICEALVKAAKKNGGHDDASALLVLRRPWFTPLQSLGERLASAWQRWARR
jgi:serine/threonine protein phosphatase PrpC